MNTQKVALITGANRGIGFETAKQLAQQGVTVVLAARQLAAAEQAAATLRAEGFDAHALQLDVTNAEERAAAAAFFSERFGKLDILVNNAGVAPADSQSLSVGKTIETTAAEFELIFNTNFFSVVYLTRELLPLLKQSGAGRVVNVSSILGSLTIHAQENSPIAAFQVLSYDAAKAALNMFTIHLAAELAGTGIKVNSAHPGWVKTELGGLDAAPMEIADGAKTSVALALLGADGPTGHFVHLDGELPW